MTSSTSNSVSGRGIRTCSLTKSSMPKNSFLFVIWAIGVPDSRSAQSLLKVSFWAGVRICSGWARRCSRGLVIVCAKRTSVSRRERGDLEIASEICIVGLV